MLQQRTSKILNNSRKESQVENEYLDSFSNAYKLLDEAKREESLVEYEFKRNPILQKEIKLVVGAKSIIRLGAALFIFIVLIFIKGWLKINKGFKRLLKEEIKDIVPIHIIKGSEWYVGKSTLSYRFIKKRIVSGPKLLSGAEEFTILYALS